MVDAADREKVEASRNELHHLLDKPQLQGIPVSVSLQLVVLICIISVPVTENVVAFFTLLLAVSFCYRNADFLNSF